MIKISELTIKKSTFNRLLIGIMVASIVSAFLGGYVLGSKDINSIFGNDENGSKIASPSQIAIQTEQRESSAITISLDDDPIMGNPDAPINLIEFSDFGCPFCKRFHATTLPLIKQNYIDSGKVKFVYRDFPILSTHPNAGSAALAAECADDQGMFWQYHDKLFENQDSWQVLNVKSAIGTFEQYAADLKLNIDDFNSCLESGKYVNEVNSDLEDGRIYGVTGTPGFFVGNEKIGYTKVIGAQPYAVFQQLLDQQLSFLNE